MKPKKRERQPDEPCECKPTHHIIASTAWSAFSGYELGMLCRQCKATWKVRRKGMGGGYVG